VDEFERERVGRGEGGELTAVDEVEACSPGICASDMTQTSQLFDHMLRGDSLSPASVALASEGNGLNRKRNAGNGDKYDA